MAKRESKQFWTAHVAAAEVSGTSKADYRRLHGLHYKSLLRWSSRALRCGEARSPAQSLVPVALRVVAPVDGATPTVRVCSSISPTMPASTDAVWLGTVLRAVSATNRNVAPKSTNSVYNTSPGHDHRIGTVIAIALAKVCPFGEQNLANPPKALLPCGKLAASCPLEVQPVRQVTKPQRF